MLTQRFQVGNQHVDIEFDGPYDSQLWSFREVEVAPMHAAAVIGSGVDMRSAVGNAIRNLRRTPFEKYANELTQEVNTWLASRSDVDMRQGDSVVRLYCVIKFVR